MCLGDAHCPCQTLQKECWSAALSRASYSDALCCKPPFPCSTFQHTPGQRPYQDPPANFNAHREIISNCSLVSELNSMLRPVKLLTRAYPLQGHSACLAEVGALLQPGRQHRDRSAGWEVLHLLGYCLPGWVPALPDARCCQRRRAPPPGPLPAWGAHHRWRLAHPAALSDLQQDQTKSVSCGTVTAKLTTTRPTTKLMRVLFYSTLL